MKALLVILILLALLVLGAMYALYRGIFFHTDKAKAAPVQMPKGGYFDQIADKVFPWIERIQNTPHEDVFITSHDGLRLYGRYFHVADGAPMHIQFHGYKGFAERDFAGCRECEWLLGYNTLLVDQRAHGRSEGHLITFGIEEYRDVLDWVAYACDRFGDTPIILSGASMGAAAVLMASDAQLPGNVRGILTDSPYDSPKDIICARVRHYHLPVKLIWGLIYVGARLFGRFDLNAENVLSSVERTQLPVLIFHGTADTIVPYQMSQTIAAACGGEVTLELFEGADHCGSYLGEPQRYIDAIHRFTDRSCGLQKTTGSLGESV